MNTHIVVTGMSAITPYGPGIDTLWNELSNGHSALGMLTEPDVSTWPVKIGGWIPDYSLKELGLTHNKLRSMGKYVKLGVAAAKYALEHAQLIEGIDPHRIGAFIASGTHGRNAEGLFRAFHAARSDTDELDISLLGSRGIDRVHPWWLLSTISNNLIFFITHFLNIKGANTNYCNSPIAGGYALDRAIASLQTGEIDIALVGGADTPVNWQMISDLSTMGILAEGDADEVLPPRSLTDAGKGAILSDAAAFLVLERADHTEQRAATPLAKVEQICFSGSYEDDVHPAPNGDDTKLVMEKLLASVTPSDKVLVDLSATGLPSWDMPELRGIQAANTGDNISYTATKPWLGHSFSASFILESIVSIMRLQQQTAWALPSPAHESIPITAGKYQHNLAINLGQGFGGNTGGVLFSVK